MEKILLVDDREDNLFSIETILEQDGYSFVKATSGRHALKILLKEFDFALILMDVKMPNLNGFETAALIYEREKLRHIPIIFITANNYGDENIFKGYKAGAVDYIYKPINPELLRAKVGVFIDLYKKTHRLVAQEQKLMASNENLAREIEERIKSEEQVINLNTRLLENIQQLKTTNEELDRFAFIASHDLQEPLRKIRTFSDILINRHIDSLEPKAGEYLQKIERSAKRMQSLIDDILSFSRFSQTIDVFTDCNLNEVLNEVLSDLEVVIKEKKAVIKSELLPIVNVIPGMISQLMLNLVSNGLKFCNKEVTPKINITCKKIKGKQIPHVTEGMEGQLFYAITVSDNGMGFEEQYSEHIFMIFKRLHSNSDIEGTGIGLAICKKIAERHNGFMYAKSVINKGSDFTFALPVN